MNTQIRRLGLTLVVCFAILFVQLNRIQVFTQNQLQDNPLNTRAIIRDFGAERGIISTLDGVVVARSVDVGGQLERERRYPEGELYAHVAGFFSFNFGPTGVEDVYNDLLAGQTTGQRFGDLSALFSDEDRTGNLTLTLRDDVQRAARDALGERRGSVVVLDPRDGAILALWSWPSFDPNPLSSTDLDLAGAAYDALDFDELDSPALAKAYRRAFPPGSTFKVVTAAAALASGRATPFTPVFPVSAGYTPPLTTSVIPNFGGSSCGGTMTDGLRVSCNTLFAELGAEVVGPDPMIAGAEAFGFNARPPIDLPAPEASSFPSGFGAVLQQNAVGVDIVEDTPGLALASIGQKDTSATPLQMALVAAAAANEGLIMTPHVMAEVRDQEGMLIEAYDPSVWRPALNGTDAEQLRTMMLGVVTSGTATGLQVPGFEVGGKTGTAQVVADSLDTHAWIIGFAGPPGEPAEVAIAVLVEATPGSGQQTGGAIAAPIAQQVLVQALQPMVMAQATVEDPPG